MQPTSHRFPENAHDALTDAQLQQALGNVRVTFIGKRAEAVAKLPEFDAVRKAGREMRDRVLADLDTHLLAFEAKVIEQGGQVHWCVDAEAARQTVLKICQEAGARRDEGHGC